MGCAKVGRKRRETASAPRHTIRPHVLRQKRRFLHQAHPPTTSTPTTSQLPRHTPSPPRLVFPPSATHCIHAWESGCVMATFTHTFTTHFIPFCAAGQEWVSWFSGLDKNRKDKWRAGRRLYEDDFRYRFLRGCALESSRCKERLCCMGVGSSRMDHFHEEASGQAGLLLSRSSLSLPLSKKSVKFIALFLFGDAEIRSQTPAL